MRITLITLITLIARIARIVFSTRILPPSPEGGEQAAS